MYICIYVYMYICIYVYMYICIYVYMYICIYVYVYMCIYVCIYIYIYVCVCMCVCVYVCVYKRRGYKVCNTFIAYQEPVGRRFRLYSRSLADRSGFKAIRVYRESREWLVGPFLAAKKD